MVCLYLSGCLVADIHLVFSIDIFICIVDFLLWPLFKLLLFNTLTFVLMVKCTFVHVYEMPIYKELHWKSLEGTHIRTVHNEITELKTTGRD